MYLAKISSNGQITLPADLRRKLGARPGDKVMFIERLNGEIVLRNPARTELGEAMMPDESAAPAQTYGEIMAEILSDAIEPEFMPDLPDGAKLSSAEVQEILIEQARAGRARKEPSTDQPSQNEPDWNHSNASGIAELAVPDADEPDSPGSHALYW